MRRRLAAGAALGAMAQLSAVGLLLTSAWLIVRAAEHPPVMYLMVAIVSVRFFGLGRAVFRYGERLLTHHVALDRMTGDRIRAYCDLDRAAPAGLPRQRRGDLVSRVVGDVTVAQDRLLRLRLPWWYALIASAAVIALLAILAAPVAALVLAVHVAFCLLFARGAVSALSRHASEESAQARGTMSADAAMLAASARDLVAYGAGPALGAGVRDSIAAQARAQRSVAWSSGLGAAVVLLSTGASTALLALLVAPPAPVLAGVLLLAPTALLESLLGVVDAERLRPSIETAQRRLDELTTLRSPVAEPHAPFVGPLRPILSATGVAAGWSEPLFAPVDLQLAPGDVIGVTGPSGIGKSTLALALAGLIPPAGGDLRLGGVDYADLSGPAVRQHVGLAGQDDVIFDTTILQNLRVADPQVTDRAALDALDRAGLGVFVRGLPQGLHTPVGPTGSQLSGGERQRLSIARLLLGGSDLLVLDEPTEHLDQPTADRLVEDLLELRATHGIVLISHTDRVLAACDRVVTLRPARPSPAGPPEQTVRPPVHDRQPTRV